MFCSVYFAQELLLRLLYMPVTDTVNKANHKVRFLLSPVCTASVLLSLAISAVSVKPQTVQVCSFSPMAVSVAFFVTVQSPYL